MNLFRPIRTTSLGGKWYDFVIIYDFLYFAWILFSAHKDEILSIFFKFYLKILNTKKLSIVNIRNDHEIKFEN